MESPSDELDTVLKVESESDELGFESGAAGVPTFRVRFRLGGVFVFSG